MVAGRVGEFDVELQAGIGRTRVIPVMLDVGTNRENLLDDPTYIGDRDARIWGERYDALIDAY